jgi:hypothetical protein
VGMDTQIVTALITSIIGGSLVAIVNHILTRKKTEAEIEKLKAETKKILAEAEKISSDAKHVVSQTSYYDSTEINEVIIYDGRQNFQGYNFDTRWSGDYNIQQGVIIISGTGASFDLRSYSYNDREYRHIPRNELIPGYRKLRASCELKVINASYEFRLYLREDPDLTEESIDDRVVNVTETQWKKEEFYFRAPPDKNYILAILADRISGDGSLQVRNLVLTERIT